MSNQPQSNSPAPGFAAWEKWALMSVIVLGLSGVVVWFNVRVFGWADGAPYIAVVAFMVLVSLLITRHIKRRPVTANFVRAAFVFEILLTVALGVNVTYSLSVMREMSVAGQAEERQTENLKATTANVEAISKLTSPAAQRAAARALEAQQKGQPGSDPAQPSTRAGVFASKEKVLFWIMIAELSVAMLATFSLLGLSVFDRDMSGIPDFLEKPQARQQAAAPSLPSPAPAYGAGKPVARWVGNTRIDPPSNVRPQ